MKVVECVCRYRKSSNVEVREEEKHGWVEESDVQKKKKKSIDVEALQRQCRSERHMKLDVRTKHEQWRKHTPKDTHTHKRTYTGGVSQSHSLRLQLLHSLS